MMPLQSRLPTPPWHAPRCVYRTVPIVMILIMDACLSRFSLYSRE